MHYYSLKSRYLRVMLLSLLFLLTAGQASAAGSGIYLRGQMNNWGTDEVWEFQPTSTTNVYTLKEVTISQGTEFKIGKSNWDDFSCGKMDNESSTLNPNSTIKLYKNTGSGNLTAGSGLTNVTLTLDLSVDPPTLKAEYNYYLKHPWPGEGWSWKQLTANGDGTYSVIAKFGNDGCNWNTKADDDGKKWIDKNGIRCVGNPQSGDECTFTLNPSAETITITKNAPVVTQVETPTFDPAGGTYDAAQSVTIACATEGATIYYTTDGNNPTTSSTQYTGAIAVNATTTLKAFAVKDGMTDSEVATATYTINIPTPTLPVYKVHGGLHTGSGWYAEGVEMTDADGDGIYTYTFTKQADNWNNYFYVTKNGSRLGADNTTLVLNSPVTYFELAGAEFNISGNLINGNEYILTLNTNDKTLCVNGATPAPTRKFDLKTVKIFGGVTDDNQWNEDNSTEMTKVNDDVYTWTYTWKGVNNHWSFRVQKSNNSWVTLEKPIEVTPGNPQELVEHNNHVDNNEYYYNGMEQGKRYTITLNAFDGTVSIESAGNGIPVYPIGVQSETELKKYDFENNPAIYLQCKVLNDERVSPEWQMIKGDDGKYHLNGFAMRGTTCRDADGGQDIDAPAFVRIYDANGTHTAGSFKLDKSAYLTNGELYNATFDPETNILSLTEDETAQGHMPFIALVGNEMKQDQNYTTPRNSHTDSAWQEAWIQYDENGNILKDREDNVMYSTMWPPKNPIYFTANIGGERLYSSEQMTFKVDNNFTAQTGAEWKAQLTGDEYKGLELDDNTSYVRYVVTDIWFVGQAKIWTGWGGQTTYSYGNPIAQWSNHANWGYGNDTSVGTEIEKAEKTIFPISTFDGGDGRERENGNFIFKQPTYYKTIEFFYNESNRDRSSLYTTLAFGNAQIEAQSHKQGDTYDRGMYKPSVTIPEGNEVLSYIIRCYDATTNQLVTLNDGIVAQGEDNPTKGEFQLDIEGLAEGKYYYEMEVVFNNSGVERTSVVKSNPFTIYFPGVYTTETQSYQLLKLNAPMNGYSYLTVAQDTEKGAIYAANLDTYGKVTAVAAITSEQRAAAVAQYDDRDNLYTDRVLVIAPVPAQFKLDAEKSSAEMTIVNYSLDETANEFVNPQTDGSMAYVIQQGHMGNVNHKAVMNYTTTVDETVTPKQTMGKEVSTYMVRPNPVAGDALVSVVREENGTTLEGKEVSYYKVNATKSFMDPNTMSVDVDYNIAGNTYRVTGDRGERGIAITNLDPAATSQATVVVKYRDADGNYTLDANKFAPVGITSSEVAIKEGDRAITDAAITYAPPYSTKWGKLVSAITTFGFSETTAEKIGDTDLAVELYEPKVYVNGGETAYGFYTRTTTPKAYFTADELREMNHKDPEAIMYYFDNGIGKDDNHQTIETVKVTIAPVYPILIDPTVKVTGFDAPIHAPALKAEGDDLAKLQNLYGKAAEKEVNTSNEGIVTGINDIASKEVQSVRFVNVAGQMSDKPFEGVNIVVTKYTDGSTQAVKMVK